MEKKILFVYPVLGQEKTISHGICSLSGELKSNGYKTGLIYLDSLDFSEAIDEISKVDPLFVAISTTFNHWGLICDFSDKLKEKVSIPIFVGGPHTILFPESINDTSSIDGICIGEGEYPLVELAGKIGQGKNYYDVYGMWFNTENGIKKNPPLELIENLDSIAMPDYEIFPDEAVCNYPSFIFSRGCPYQCTYCCNHAFRKILKYKNNKFTRFKSVDRCIKEIKSFLKRYYMTHINFDDDVFMQSKDWRKEFLAKYSTEVDAEFECNMRPELVSEGICEELKNAGCFAVKIGLESGDEMLREKVLKRKMKNEVILNACKIARTQELQVMTFNIVGIPGETKELYEKTVEINKAIDPENFQVSIYYPYPGTELGDYCRGNGLVRSENYNFLDKSVLDLKEFNSEDIQISKALFPFKVYYPKQGLNAVCSIKNSESMKFFRKAYKGIFPEEVIDVFGHIVEKDYGSAMDIFMDIPADYYSKYHLVICLAEKILIETNNYYTEKLYKIASDFERSGKYDESKMIFDMIYRVYKNSYSRFAGGAMYHMAEILHKENKYRDAYECYKNVGAINPDHEKSRKMINELKVLLNAKIIG